MGFHKLFIFSFSLISTTNTAQSSILYMIHLEAQDLATDFLYNSSYTYDIALFRQKLLFRPQSYTLNI